MMNSLFSSFEPSNLFTPVLYLMPILIMHSSFIQENKSKMLITMTKNFMGKELKPIGKNKLFNQMMINLFTLILLLNLLSLTPLSFTINSLASTIIPTSMTLFFMIMLMKSKSNPKEMLIHLTPQGSPLLLSPILVIIELTSLMIRPVTISIRLMTNMMAGHLMIHLVNKLTLTSVYFMIPMVPTSLILLLMEVGISIIQAYIFCMLMSIYMNE